MAAKQGEPIDSDDVIFSFAFTLIKLNSEFSILNKNSVSLSLSLSLSLFCYPVCSLLPIVSHFFSYSPGNDHDMLLQTQESRRSWEKAFCSDILVPVITVRKIE